MSSRAALGAQLTGSGIEVGPGHVPYPTPDHVSVLYVDRLTIEDHRALFPEIPPDAWFPEPDIIADLDVDGLREIEPASQDFVICSHVIEHLADPIGFLADAHRVLRVGGLALLLLPDRRMTFDRDRAASPLSCLVQDHAVGANAPDDEHVLDFLVKGDQGPDFRLPDDADELARLVQWHRERSIHVHCWTDDEFPHVLVHCMRELDHGWELVDQRSTTEAGGLEFGYLLRKTREPDVERFTRELHVARRRSERSHRRAALVAGVARRTGLRRTPT